LSAVEQQSPAGPLVGQVAALHEVVDGALGEAEVGGGAVGFEEALVGKRAQR